MTVIEFVGHALLVWLVIGACALPFAVKILESYREEQEDDQI